MKKDFLERLSAELDKRNVTNKDEILKKYEKRYNFGIESGMTDDEIESMLKSPEEIAKQYGKTNTNTKNTKSNEIKTNIEIKVLGDDIYFRHSQDDKVHILCDELDRSLYTIRNSTQEGLVISFLNDRYLSLNRKKAGKFVIEVPEGRKFNEVKISTSSGDIVLGDLKCNYISLTTTSGDVSTGEVVSPRINVHTVSGDLVAKEFKCQDINLSTVSGDLSTLKIHCNNSKLSSVSGDIKIGTFIGQYKLSNVSGEIFINGEQVNGMKFMYKGA